MLLYIMKLVVIQGPKRKSICRQIQKFRDGTDPMYPSIDYFDVYYDKASMQNHREPYWWFYNFQYTIMLGFWTKKVFW